MSNILRISRKELAAVFHSPAAFIFIGVFLAVTLFTFFWVETFFARNIADVRPLFEWMPVLLIFLVAALTMRSWSEEMRAGTLEVIMTTPAPSWHFVAGKFLACWALIGVALALTLPVAFTVGILGPVDWGPVMGAYIATLFLAAAYISIGLFVSAQSDNQIVSLIITALICGFFYLLGSPALTAFAGIQLGEFLSLLGSGSRFESITRGVLDIRDIYFYLSILGVFLALNVYVLERLRWSKSTKKATHVKWQAALGLIIANLLAGNIWLQQVSSVRVDLTEGRIYSISDTTRTYLAQLQEPLLIRGYFSPKTHPLLSPLVPKMRDLLEEYAIAGGNRVRVEFINPMEKPELEEEANRRFDIKPLAFQTANKYQSAVTNSYFDVLIKYGDEHETLNFRDLVEIKTMGEGKIDVELRNPEYDITRAIKKVLFAYQASGDLFANITAPVTFKGYISDNKNLPEALQKARKALDGALDQIAEGSKGKFSSEIVDPAANDGATAKHLQETFGLRPLAVGLFDTKRYWFHFILESNGDVVQVALPEALDADGIKRSIEAGVKRFSKGFLKTVAVHRPEQMPMHPQMGRMPRSDFNSLENSLRQNANLRIADLKDGRVPDEADILTVMSPKDLDEKQLFAIDQFLMKGGTVVMATSPYEVAINAGFKAKKVNSGVEDWLKHHGISIADTMVLDRRHSALPIPIDRKVGGFSIREIKKLDYPYFADIRKDGLNRESGITKMLGQVTMSWASPISVDAEKNKDRKITRLLESSEEAWTSDATDLLPDFKAHKELGFPVAETQGRQLLGVVVEGKFASYFAGKTSPLVKAAEAEAKAKKDDKDKANKDEPVLSSVIERSPDSGRIILLASNSFLSDNVLVIASQSSGNDYLNALQLAENAIDWSVEDRGLLTIRSRGHFSRTLEPMARSQQLTWEYANYGLAAVGLLLVFVLYRQTRRQAQARYSRILNFRRA